MEHIHLEHLDSCSICGFKELRQILQVRDYTVSQSIFSIVSCQRCGAWFTSPRPISSQIGAYYKSTSYISHTNSSSGLLSRLYQLIRKKTLATKLKLISSYRPIGRILDVGCGTGQFLSHLLKAGYAVNGVEPDDDARTLAESTLQRSLFASISEIHAIEPYDVITMWHVLEHVPDLRLTLSRISRLLSEDGYLFIAIPDRDSWDAQHYGITWAAYDVPRHLSHLRRSDMKTLLDQLGFQIIKTRHMYFDAFYISILSERYRGTPTILVYPKALLMGLYSNTRAILSNSPTSSTLYIIRKSKSP